MKTFEQYLGELSRDTLKSYIKKADKQANKAVDSYSRAAARRHDFAPDTPAMAKNARKFKKRDAGAALARKKLGEEVSQKDLNTVTYAPGQDSLINKNVRKRRQDSVAGEAVNPYAVGTAVAKKKTGDKPPLEKKTITLAHKIAKPIKNEAKDPCWKGYEMIGRKKKNGKSVPNCVPTKEETQLDEILSIQGRLKRARDIKKNKAKLAMGKHRQSMRIASKERLQDRAKRHARAALVARITKGIPKGELSMQRRAEIERRLERMKNVQTVIARKLLPQVRKDELLKKRSDKSTGKK